MGKKQEIVDKKIIILGNETTGKTSVLKNIKNGPNYISEQLMSNKYELRGKNKSKIYTRITLWDGIVSGYKTDYRPIAYKNTDMIIMFYAIDSFKSYQSIQARWLPEVRTFAPDVPIMVIGNKLDKREINGSQKLVSTEDGSKLSREINAIGFLECSAFDTYCLDVLVQTLLDNFSAKNKTKRKDSCTLM